MPRDSGSDGCTALWCRLVAVAGAVRSGSNRCQTGHRHRPGERGRERSARRSGAAARPARSHAGRGFVPAACRGCPRFHHSRIAANSSATGRLGTLAGGGLAGGLGTGQVAEAGWTCSATLCASVPPRALRLQRCSSPRPTSCAGAGDRKTSSGRLRLALSSSSRWAYAPFPPSSRWELCRSWSPSCPDCKHSSTVQPRPQLCTSST